jgi:hypothetical protein
MPKIIIELTDLEYNSLQTACDSAEEWTENLVKERARIAFIDISQIVLKNCLNDNIQIPIDKLEIIKLAIEKNWI